MIAGPILTVKDREIGVFCPTLAYIKYSTSHACLCLLWDGIWGHPLCEHIGNIAKCGPSKAVEDTMVCSIAWTG